MARRACDIRLTLLLGLLPGLAGAADAAAPMWEDTALARLEALALIQTLNAQILSNTSATRVLERWCREHALATVPVVVARRIEPADTEVSAATREALGVGPHETVRYRRVELDCGDRVLSLADNWYVPARLTAQMNRLLDTTQTPFGKVVQPLHPHRETLEVRLLWSPLPEGWERAAAQPAAAPARALALPPALFEHRALVYAADHRPLAEVREVYQRDLLAFPQPRVADRAP